MAIVETDIQRENRARIVAYFESGCATKGDRYYDDDGFLDRPGYLGVEVEHFLMRTSDQEPLFYEPHDGIPGVRDVLEHLAAYYPQVTRNAAGDILGLANESGNITIEPAAQLEISIAPLARLSDIAKAYNDFRGYVDAFLAPYGCSVACQGYRPKTKALDMPLIPKQRYAFMDRYFHELGTHGERMMRGSASTQVSIDYFSESDAVRKFRVGTALAPILAFICDNTPVFEGEKNEEPLARMALWRDVDPHRCGVIPGTFSRGFGFESVANYLLHNAPIFVTRAKAAHPDDARVEEVRWVGDERAMDAYGDAPLATEDIEHLISMFWTDIRLKRFVEIRPADCMPDVGVLGYAALVKGIFYSPANLTAIEDALGVQGDFWPLSDSSVEMAIAKIRQHGKNAAVYGHYVYEWVEFLFNMANASLEEEEAVYLLPLRAHALEGVPFA
ncbi:glutamate-cysteine ligase family protein [Hugonella massiliensis]|uniref:glutamate-cysteine ligase family protein n=1 Tax=Hugonella massiliensis TaxID=1720315 RepID=UPI00073E3C87|nr:glutamate-cysteine ligase family protein [Hugonella massiliensis]